MTLGLKWVVVTACVVTAACSRPQPAVASGSSAGEVIQPPAHSPKGISVKGAVALCRSFLRAWDTGAATAKATIVGRPNAPGSSENLQINIGKTTLFVVDLRMGMITNYWEIPVPGVDLGRHEAGVVRKMVDQASADAFLKRLASRLGIPKELEATSMHPIQLSPGTPMLAKSDQVYVTYGIRRDGHLVNGVASRMLRIDNVTGGLLSYIAYDLGPVVIESRQEKLSLSDAEKIAGKVANSARIRTALFPGEGVDHDPSELVFVCPNGGFGGLRYPEATAPTFRKAVRVRLAWVIRYQHGAQVWIDAGDRRLLGGNEALKMRF